MIEQPEIRIGDTPITTKRVITMVIILTFFVVGHSLFYLIKIENIHQVTIVLRGIMLGICLFGSLFLMLNSQGLRSRKIFALQMGCYGLTALMSIMVVLNVQAVNIIETRKLASPAIMIYGNILAFVLLLYPFELLRTNKTKLKEYIILFLPVLATSLFYYGYIYIMELEMTATNSWSDMLANIHHFDIWFRFAILPYPIVMMIFIYDRKRKYIDWCRKNFSNDGYIELGWLNYYLFGFFLILISYLVVMLMHNNQSIIMHTICFIAFFSFTLFRILQQEAPSQAEIGELNTSTVAEHTTLDFTEQNSKDSKRWGCDREENIEDKFKFVDKIPQYKAELEVWMSTSKPFRDKDFKLLDVMHILPLNRSYLSRLFNEGYNEPFFNFVMRYRIEESLRLLETSPDLTITRISELCGFSSPSVFGRAFVKHMAMTPKQYRGQIYPNLKESSSTH